MSVDFKNSRTKENLMRSFAGECQARTRYSLAAEEAKKKNMYFIQNIFKLTAHQEEQHAKVFYDFLKQENGINISVDGAYPVGNYSDLVELLREAEHNETEEFTKVYPSFAEIAEEEGFPTIAEAFRNIAKIEHSHAERFKCFAELLEQGRMFKSSTPIDWICLNCGNIVNSSDAPKICPVCHKPEGYWVPYKYYKFCAEKYFAECC